ncbi:iron-sulfur cluster assembly protein [Ochrobactrum anthropi ATCC 49188]|nr:iron-sulfur cluster assembly protein [Brucella anthropi ATCC 49188]
MTSVTREQVQERLKTVTGPDFESDVVSLGLVSDIFIADGKVSSPSRFRQHAPMRWSRCGLPLKRP